MPKKKTIKKVRIKDILEAWYGNQPVEKVVELTKRFSEQTKKSSNSTCGYGRDLRDRS